MTSLSRKEEIKTLKVAFFSLSKLFPLSKTLSTLLEKDFKQISQSEAYEVLRYLVNSCIREKKLKFVDQKVWKGLDADSKVTVEKFKKDILEAIKNVSTKGKVVIPVLKKSELMVPSCPRFFACCLALSSYALSFQLSLMGIQFWPAEPKKQQRRQIMRKEIISFTEEINALQKDYFEINKKIEIIQHDFNSLEQKKLETQCIVENEILTSTNVSEDCLKNAKVRDEYINSLAKKTDELNERNLKRLEVLKSLDVSLEFLNKFIESGHEKILIDGKDLIHLISYEAQLFAEKEGITLFENGSLSLEGLLNVVKKSISDCEELPSNVTKVLELKPYESTTKFLMKIEQMKKDLESEVNDLRYKLGCQLNLKHESEVEAWLESFFVPVPSICFDNKHCGSSVMKEPIIDLMKINRLVAIREMQNNKVNYTPSLVIQEKASTVSGLTRTLRRRSKSAGRNISLFTAKAESTRYLRDHQSFRNLNSHGLGRSLMDLSFRSNSITKDTETSTISTISNVLSPTSRLPEEMHFSGVSSISPISHVSQKYSVFSDEEDPEIKPRDSIASATSFTFSSPPSSWRTESSREMNDTRDTFESSETGFPSLNISDISSSSQEA